MEPSEARELKQLPDGKERIRELHETIGELTVERDSLEGARGNFPGLGSKR